MKKTEKQFSLKNWIVIVAIFLTAFVIRISMVMYDFGWDVHNHIIWGKDFVERGSLLFYSTRSSEIYATPYPNYPPLSIAIFALIEPLPRLIFDFFWWINVNVPIFPSKLLTILDGRPYIAAVYKLPAIFADLGIGALALIINMKRKNNNAFKYSLMISLLILFNPVMIFLSALWGQIESIVMFFIALSLISFIKQNNPTIGILFFIFALLVKPTAILFLPILILILLKNIKSLSWMVTFLFGFILFWIVFLPFLPKSMWIYGPIDIFLNKILFTQSIQFATNGALNFWAIVTGSTSGISSQTPWLLGISIKTWGILMTMILLFFNFWQKRNIFLNLENMGNLIICTVMICFIFLPQMHERYYVYALIGVIFTFNSKKNWYLLFILLNLAIMVNLYRSWPVPEMKWLIVILKSYNATLALALVNLLLGLKLIFAKTHPISVMERLSKQKI